MKDRYKHQATIKKEDPLMAGLFLGTGSGKTRIALDLSKDSTMVIAPKTQVEDGNWEREAAAIKFKYPLGVISKETFRRDQAELDTVDTLIIDEAHTCLGVTPSTRQRKGMTIPKASQLFEAVEAYIARSRPKRLYLCTATIMRSPMTVWAAAKLLGRVKPEAAIRKPQHVVPNFYAFREMFYTRLPMPGREVWAPKRSSQAKDALAKIVRQIGYVGRLEDFFDVPDQTFITKYVELTEQQKKTIKTLKLDYPDPIVLIGKKHQVENGVLAGDEFSVGETFPNAKVDKILELAEEFPRLVVFAKYRAQITDLHYALRKHFGLEKEILTLTGDTKNRGELIAAANRYKSCVFIAQAQISAGWELPEYPVMVFASRTYSYVDYVQAIGRIHRANHLKKNLYINLVVKGGVDEAVDKALTNKQDFDDRIYADL